MMTDHPLSLADNFVKLSLVGLRAEEPADDLQWAGCQLVFQSALTDEFMFEMPAAFTRSDMMDLVTFLAPQDNSPEVARRSWETYDAVVALTARKNGKLLIIEGRAEHVVGTEVSMAVEFQDLAVPRALVLREAESLRQWLGVGGAR